MWLWTAQRVYSTLALIRDSTNCESVALSTVIQKCSRSNALRMRLSAPVTTTCPHRRIPHRRVILRMTWPQLSVIRLSTHSWLRRKCCCLHHGRIIPKMLLKASHINLCQFRSKLITLKKRRSIRVRMIMSIRPSCSLDLCHPMNKAWLYTSLQIWGQSIQASVLTRRILTLTVVMIAPVLALEKKSSPPSRASYTVDRLRLYHSPRLCIKRTSSWIICVTSLCLSNRR